MGGCGVVDRARARLEAFLGDDAAPETSPEPVEPVAVEAPAAEPVEPPAVEPLAAEPPAVEPPAVIERASSSDTSDDAAHSEASDAGTSGPAQADDTDTDALPMSYAVPPEDPTAGGVARGAPDSPSAVPPDPTLGAPSVEPTPTTPPPAGGSTPLSSCLEGEWEAEDLHTWFRRDVAKQARGRPVRFRGESGRHRLRFEPGVLHGEAEHRRIGFDARLATVDIRYSVDVHGEFEATFRIESPAVLVVDPPSRSTLRVREVVRFSAEKSETRTLALPVKGRWQASCSPGALELRLLEEGVPGPALRFVRPKP